MVYHGKKTVPAELRRDMWVPYYSVHFGDSRLGLRAYQLLREFSLRRQLSPPPEMITVTEEFLKLRRPKDPSAAEEFDRLNKKRIGHTMEKKERARVLMDQKATSVADIAAVLEIQEKEIADGILDKEQWHQKRFRSQRRRQREAIAKDAELAEEYNARIEALEQQLSEREGVEVKIGEVGDYPETPGDVKILWRDVHDANYAASWPEKVQHGELEVKRDNIIGGERAHESFAEA